MQRRRLEQIDLLTDVVHSGQQRAEELRQKYKDPELGAAAANITMAVLAYKAILVRRERRQQMALEALQKSRCGMSS